MSDELCGEIKNDGEACTFPAKYPDGKCGHHTDTTETPDKGPTSKLEENPELADLIIEELEQGATVSEALAEAEEKTGVFVSQSTHGNWMSKGKSESAEELYKEYRKGITRARLTGRRRDRQSIKKRAQEEGDLRLEWKIHMKQYGDEYDSDATETEDNGPPFAVSEELLELWEQQTANQH